MREEGFIRDLQRFCGDNASAEVAHTDLFSDRDFHPLIDAIDARQGSCGMKSIVRMLTHRDAIERGQNAAGERTQ